MRSPHFLFLALLVLLCACSTSSHRKTPRDPTVVIYHVKRGSEAELEPLLTRLWDTYQREGLVFSEPHVLVRAHEDDEHDRFIEVFMWRGYFATEYPSERVTALLEQIQSLCEPRGGHLAIEFRNAQMFAPRVEESLK
jgi:hypothetical protein